MSYIEYWEAYSWPNSVRYSGRVFVNGAVVHEFKELKKMEMYDLGRSYGIKEYKGFTYG